MKIREHFADEAREFTPWLSSDEGLELLGEVISMNLELVGIEQRVGPYRVDIVAKDGDTTVIVENQLDATDHRHLGQLLVYAAGREADVVVWVARQVTDEHRAVLDWLNEETRVTFWALEFELWRIGDSIPAPKLNVVCEPNVLSKPPGIGESVDLSEGKLLQLEFWKQLADYLEKADTPFNSRKPQPQQWYDLALGTSRAHISLTALQAKSGRVGCDLYMGTEEANQIYAALYQDKDAIDAELGDLDWQPLPDRKACRITQSRDANLEDRETWGELIEWLVERAIAFRTTFADRVKQIQLSPTGTSSGITPTPEHSPPPMPDATTH